MNLSRIFGFYTLAFAGFTGVIWWLESAGIMGRTGIGYAFMAMSVGIYALIGIITRTSDPSQYYVAGRSVPAIYNGMATGSDWMSAASFISMAGLLFATGYNGLAFIMGWTGGYVLLALLLAPYLRKFGQFTIPDFLGARYGGNFARIVGILAAILVSLTYLTAQLTGVGIIVSRFLGIDYNLGVYAGLLGVLVCSVLGGMRAVTWTQVAQYIVLISAYMIPVIMLSFIVFGPSIPQLSYGPLLKRITTMEQSIAGKPADGSLPESVLNPRIDPAKEAETRALWKADAEATRAALANPNTAAVEKEKLEAQLKVQVAQSTPPKGYTAVPAQSANPAGDMLNFVCLMFCLMVGTAGLPHILMRYYTTPSVRQARASVAWSLVFIAVLYITAPAYAAFSKYVVLSQLVGTPITELPRWVESWRVVGDLFEIVDRNSDGIVQFGDFVVRSTDFVVLATPEMANLPYVVTGLVMAGGLAAALSTADGLLLTIANALSHDLYFKVINPNAPIKQRLVLSKVLLVVGALFAAWLASFRSALIAETVAWAFSFAASSFFPVLFLGIWWRRATWQGAVAGMIVGLGIALFYTIGNRFYGVDWFGIKSIASGVFGVGANFLVTILVSLITPPPPQPLQDFVYSIRFPRGAEQGRDVRRRETR
jgi:cation/acetate symporter